MSSRRSRSGGKGIGKRRSDKEISPEETFFNGLIEIAIRGGDDSDVRLSGLTAADALELALLQGAQQSDLDTKWQFADLIENKRACIPTFKPPNTSLLPSLNAPPPVPHHPAPHQSLRQN